MRLWNLFKINSSEIAYPIQLIPRSVYSFINVNDIGDLSDLYLLRSYNEEDDPKEIETLIPDSKKMLDFSVSLSGHYLPEHFYYKILKDFDHYFDFWDGGNCKVPQDNEYDYEPDQRCYFIKLSEIHEFPYKDVNPKDQNLKYHFKCEVIHKPTKGNYWHFELHWFNMDQGGKELKNIPRALKAQFKAALMMKADHVSKPDNFRKLEYKYYI